MVVGSALGFADSLSLAGIGRCSLPAGRKRKSYGSPIRALCAAADVSRLEEVAKLTVSTFIRSGMVVGLGTGRASHLVIQHLGRQLRAGKLRIVTGIPTSVSSASEAAKAGVPLEQYPTSLQIDFCFDDADIMEEGSLVAVIGHRKLQGEDSIIQEKFVLLEAKKVAFIVPEKQYKKDLQGAIPVLVNTGNWMEAAEEIDDLFLGDAEVWRRPSLGYAGPRGGDFPLVTKEGHNVLDVIFTSPMSNLAEVGESLSKIDGVVEHGVVSGIRCSAIIVSENGLQRADNFSENAFKEVGTMKHERNHVVFISLHSFKFKYS